MASIRKRLTRDGKTRYEVQVRLLGVRPETGTFGRVKDAQRWAQKRETAIRERRYFGGAESRHRTVAELIQRYEATAIESLAASERTRRAAMLHWWVDRIGSLKLAEVTPAVISEQRDALAKRVSHARQNRYLAALSRCFSLAVREWHWSEVNPISMVSRRKEAPGRERYLSAEEAQRLLSTASEVGSELASLVAVALGTGARAGELLALTWRDVDLSRRVITFRSTKSGKPRTLPLDGEALKALTALSRLRLLGEDRVWPRFPRAEWERARKAAGLAEVRFHDLRHTFASWLAMSGASLAELAEALGHSTLLMVRRYVHFQPQHTAAVVARMHAKFRHAAFLPE